MIKKWMLILALSALTGTFAAAHEGHDHGVHAPAEPAKAKKKMNKKAAKKTKKKAAEQKAMWKCEHCNITSNEPGKCPCGRVMKKI